MEQDKQKALAAIQNALMSAEGLDPRTQKAIEKAEGPFRGKVKGIKRNDTIFPNVPDQELGGVMEVGGIDPPAGAVAKIPPALARALGKQLVGHLPSGKIKQVFSALQKKYPRLMGHVSAIDVNRRMPFQSAIGEQSNEVAKMDYWNSHAPDYTRKLREKEGEILNTRAYLSLPDSLPQTAIDVDQRQLRLFHPEADFLSKVWVDPNLTLPDMASTAAHELAHTAQQLRLGRAFGPNYGQVNSVLGYKNNPYEEFAREAGDNFKMRFMAEQGSPIIKEGWVLKSVLEGSAPPMGRTSKVLSQRQRTPKHKYTAEKVLPSGRTRKK